LFDGAGGVCPRAARSVGAHELDPRAGRRVVVAARLSDEGRAPRLCRRLVEAPQRAQRPRERSSRGGFDGAPLRAAGCVHGLGRADDSGAVSAGGVLGDGAAHEGFGAGDRGRARCRGGRGLAREQRASVGASIERRELVVDRARAQDRRCVGLREGLERRFDRALRVVEALHRGAVHRSGRRLRASLFGGLTRARAGAAQMRGEPVDRREEQPGGVVADAGVGAKQGGADRRAARGREGRVRRGVLGAERGARGLCARRRRAGGEERAQRERRDRRERDQGRLNSCACRRRERLEPGAHRRRASLGVCGEGGAHRAVEPRSDAGDLRGAAVDRGEQGVDRGRLEGAAVSERFVERDGERVEVRALGGAVAAEGLGGHVEGRSEEAAGEGEGGVIDDRGALAGLREHRAREPEVREPRAVGADDDVVWLDVAVQQPSLVRRGEPIADRAHDGHDRRCAARLAAVLAQRRSADDLHRDVHGLAVLSDVEDRHDVGVREARERRGFAQQSLSRDGVLRALGPQKLERDLAPEARIPPEKHLARGSFADLCAHRVRAERISLARRRLRL
jgi:hypothetical protein